MIVYHNSARKGNAPYTNTEDFTPRCYLADVRLFEYNTGR
jgi:hypothetical protein